MKSRGKSRMRTAGSSKHRSSDKTLTLTKSTDIGIEVCILAGGLSARMGRDKSKLRWDGKTFLAHIRATARKLGFPVRVIRRDLVPRCGPLGGIFTALTTSSADAILFLACDMPQVSESLLLPILEKARSQNRAIFTVGQGLAGFPLLLTRRNLPTVECLLAEKQFSLQKLSQATGATFYRPTTRLMEDLFNVNTPGDWVGLKKQLRKRPESSEGQLVN